MCVCIYIDLHILKVLRNRNVVGCNEYVCQSACREV